MPFRRNAVRHQIEQTPESVCKRNYPAMLTEGIFFLMGFAFIDINAVIPVFIHSYTNSVFLAGLASTLYHASSFVMEILIGPYVKRIRNVPRYVSWLALLFRPLPLLMVPILFMNISPLIKVGSFLVMYALLRGGDGLISISWGDLFGRTIPSEKRGLLMGYQQLLGGIASLLAGMVVKTVLDHPALIDDQRYAIIFSGSAVVLIISALALFFTRDLPHSIDTTKPNHWQYYREFPGHLKKNPIFANVVLIRVLSTTTHMVAPFIIIFGQQFFQLSSQEVSTLVYLQITGGLLGGFVWGRISKQFGHHRVIQVSMLTGFILSLTIILLMIAGPVRLPAGILWPLVVINGMNLNNWSGFINHTIDIASSEERTIYLMISNLVIFPFTFLTFIAGIMVESLGYLPIFIISTLAAAVAVWRGTKLNFPEGPSESLVVTPLPSKESDR